MLCWNLTDYGRNCLGPRAQIRTKNLQIFVRPHRLADPDWYRLADWCPDRGVFRLSKLGVSLLPRIQYIEMRTSTRTQGMALCTHTRATSNGSGPNVIAHSER